jgi:hypothetical protein
MTDAVLEKRDIGCSQDAEMESLEVERRGRREREEEQMEETRRAKTFKYLVLALRCFGCPPSCQAGKERKKREACKSGERTMWVPGQQQELLRPRAQKLVCSHSLFFFTPRGNKKIYSRTAQK